jgi:GDP-L-fucose synthase
MRKILVTGASSFLGHHLIPKLEQISIKAIGHDSRFAYTQWKILTPTSKELDLTSLPSVLKYFDENKFDTIIHLAAKVGGIGLNKNKPADLTLDNLLMGMNLYSGIKLHLDKIKNVYNISTTCGYPKNCPVPFKEEDLWNGREEETNNGYSYAKKALIVLGEKFRIQYGLNSVCLMVANLLGEHDHFDLENSHVVPALIRKMVDIKEDQMQYKMCGVPIPMWGDGSATRDFLYAGDCAEAICKAVDKNINYDKPINIGTGKEISIKELGEQLINIIGVRGYLSFDKGSNPLNGQPRRCLEVSKAKEILGFEATTSLRESLIKTVRWFEEQRKIEKEKKPMLYIEVPSMWIKLPKEDMYYKEANDKKIINNRKLLPYEFDSMFNGWQNLYFYCNRNDVSTVTNTCIKHPVKVVDDIKKTNTVRDVLIGRRSDARKDLEKCKDKITVEDLYSRLGKDPSKYLEKYKDKFSVNDLFKDLDSIKYKLAIDSLIKEFDTLNVKKTDIKFVHNTIKPDYDNKYIKPKKNTKKPNDVKFDFKAALKRAGMSDAQLEETGVINKQTPYQGYITKQHQEDINWMLEHHSLKCADLKYEELAALSKNFNHGEKLKELETLNKLDTTPHCDELDLKSTRVHASTHEINKYKKIIGKITSIDELIKYKEYYLNTITKIFSEVLLENKNNKEIFKNLNDWFSKQILWSNEAFNSRMNELVYPEAFAILNKAIDYKQNDITTSLDGYDIKPESRLQIYPDLSYIDGYNNLATRWFDSLDGYEIFPIKLKDNKLPIEKTVTEVKVKRDEEETARIKTKLSWHKAQQAATDKYNEIFGKINSIDELKKIKEYYITANSFYATPNNELPENVQFRLIQETCGVNDAFSSRLKVLEKAEAEKQKEIQTPVIENNVEIIPPSLPYKISRFVSSIKHAVKDLID